MLSRHLERWLLVQAAVQAQAKAQAQAKLLEMMMQQGQGSGAAKLPGYDVASRGAPGGTSGATDTVTAKSMAAALQQGSEVNLAGGNGKRGQGSRSNYHSSGNSFGDDFDLQATEGRRSGAGKRNSRSRSPAMNTKRPRQWWCLFLCRG